MVTVPCGTFSACGWNGAGVPCVYSYVDAGRIVLDAPPTPPAPTHTNVLARLMPVAMVAAMGGMTALYLTSTDATSRNPMFLFFPAMMAVSLIGTLAYGSRGAGRSGELAAQRAEYLRYLDTVDGALARAGEDLHRYLHAAHPAPAVLWTLAGTPRMWERAEGDPEFGMIRIGIGERAGATAVAAPGWVPGDDADPVTTEAVQRLLAHRETVGDVPVTVSLRSVRTLAICGEPAAARSVARALLCQIATLHHPDTMSISAAPVTDWDWLKWLPHQRSSQEGRHHVVVADEGVPARDGTTLIILTAGSGAPTVTADGVPVAAVCDEMPEAEAAACARRIARHRPRRPSRSLRRDWPALMGIDDPDALDVDVKWSRDLGSDLLRVPIGVADDGSVVELDIKEAAAHGMGPHGLCVGATGSGKSEFLRTLVLGMVCAHPPELLNLVLVDFKGGATFLGLEAVHHVSAVITNLADEAPLVSRMRDALSGEITRRQEMLRAAGNLTNITQYAQARARDDTLAPLPALLVIVDEFSELLTQHPDFSEVFVAIGRLGRSLGIHLLLATQRLDEGRLRGLETHLSYRVCLKTFSAGESRAVLGVPDAYSLSSQPGAAYLKTASGVLTRFQTAYVSGGYTPASRPRSQPLTVRPFTSSDHDVASESTVSQRPLLGAVLTRLAGRGAPAHRVWLPPLTSAPRLADLLHGTPGRRLQVPIGVVDCPFEQQQMRHVVDLSGPAGNLAVAGAPRSGKSTVLSTVMTALAATHDAAAVQFYCLDFGGGELTGLQHLPHVGSVASRHEGELCRRIVAHVESVVRHRESATDETWNGHVFLVVDGWATLRQDFDGLEPAITALAGRGLAYGVHVMIAASRWADLRPALKDQIGSRIELRLGDPAESEMDRRRARDLADRPPGRALTREGREMAIALADQRLPVRRDGPGAAPVELLPAHVDRSAIAAPVPRRGEVLLGLGERELSAVSLDLTEHSHLMVLGENQCGKTASLRLLCAELVAAPQEARLEIVDFRRTLLGTVDSDRLTGYAVTPAAVTSRVAAITGVLADRMPGEDVTQRQLRDRSWWHGPEIYVVIDDYDLVAGATGNPLTPLADFLPHARDLGLHVVVARRSGGAARAMFDPLLARMRDMGCAGLMMSANAEDGVLLGAVRPGRLPPGRGTLIARGRPDELLQVAWTDPP